MTTQDEIKPATPAEGLGNGRCAVDALFSIRGEWLHVAGRRIRLSAVVAYHLIGGDVTISYGHRLQDTLSLYGPHSEGVEWGGSAKALVAALDDFFAKNRDEPTTGS